MFNSRIFNVPAFLVTFLCCSGTIPWMYQPDSGLTIPQLPTSRFWATPQPTLYEAVWTKGSELYEDGIEALRDHLEKQLQDDEKEEEEKSFYELEWSEMLDKINPWYKPKKMPLDELIIKVATLKYNQMRYNFEEFMKSNENKKLLEEFFLSFLILFITLYELGSQLVFLFVLLFFKSKMIQNHSFDYKFIVKALF